MINKYNIGDTVFIVKSNDRFHESRKQHIGEFHTIQSISQDITGDIYYEFKRKNGWRWREDELKGMKFKLEVF